MVCQYSSASEYGSGSAGIITDVRSVAVLRARPNLQTLFKILAKLIYKQFADHICG
jgi:hypothetical protein